MNSDRKRKRIKYPITSYIAVMIIAVMGLVLLSYFVQQRNHDQQITHYSQTLTDESLEQQSILL